MKNCSENFVLEPVQGVLQVCKYNENAEWVREGLRAIAELRNTTHVLIDSACDNHKFVDTVERWSEARARVEAERASKMIDFTKFQK